MDSASSPFSHQLRVRVCGLLVESEAILLTKIHSPVNDKLVWSPPGGAIRFGESMAEALKREFREETRLRVEILQLLHINELVRPPFHALECYFEVKRTGGTPELGSDPELAGEQQKLIDLQWIPIAKLSDIQFVPPSLLEMILQWEDRASFPVFCSE